MGKKPIKTTKKQILRWCSENVYEVNYGVDWGDLYDYQNDEIIEDRCFRCAYVRQTERCHVVPESLGGEDKPSNLRLLCPECHVEAPNVNDPDAMDDWIRRTSVGFYNTFWACRRIYQRLKEECGIEVSWHFGEGVNASSLLWIQEQLEKFATENPEKVGSIIHEELMGEALKYSPPCCKNA